MIVTPFIEGGADEYRRDGSPVNADDLTLLERFRPFVQFDSRESYRADSPAVLVDLAEATYCNRLCKLSGEIVAVAEPSLFKVHYDRLDLDLLGGTGAGRYATGHKIEATDYVEAVGHDYPADAARMHLHPDLADRLYGHVSRDGNWCWLQYWFFYYFNEKFMDRHQGDWEMVQIGFEHDPGGQKQVTCSQHDHAQTKQWHEIEARPTADGEALVVYPARGSHANYFDSGMHLRALANWIDYHDGGSGQPIRPEVVPIADTTPSWVTWPGRWGATRGTITESPPGPAQQHGKWLHPAKFCELGKRDFNWTLVPNVPPPAPPLPGLKITGDASHIAVRFTFAPVAAGQGVPAHLLVTMDGVGQAWPPLSYPLLVRGPEGEFAITPSLKADAYEVRVTVVSASGAESATSDPVTVGG
jgi:hypothetical protein